MSDSSGNWFSKLFKKAPQPEPKHDPGVALKPTPHQEPQPEAPYKEGNFIGQNYEVFEVLGKGGFGVVYLVYSHEVGGVYALKTFRDEFLADPEIRKRFQKEASVWVELGRNPYLVRAYFVENVAGRLYIEMEYIVPNDEGLNSLEGYLQRRPPDLAQSLRWAIQVCNGMEYAYSKGVRAHRDLKPANIMISQEKTAKITDFGLAGVIGKKMGMRTTGLSAQPGRIGFSIQTVHGKGFGTPTYMPPEQFDNAAGCDERSDIYSFGIVLYQMAAGGRLPFLAPLPRDGSEQAMLDFWQAMWRLHCESPVPRLDSPLFAIIQRCLEKSSGKRYQTFKEVRKDLEPLLQQLTGEEIIPPQLKELEAWEWNSKGGSLDNLGHSEEAIRCYDKALELDPRHANAWNNKGNSLDKLGRFGKAISCFDKALEIDPHFKMAWSNKSGCLSHLGQYEEAVYCCDKALELDPHYAFAWINKGNNLINLGRFEDGILCYEKALELDPGNPLVWYNKGVSFGKLGRYREVLHCVDKALELDPYYVFAWYFKALAEDELFLWREAERSYKRCLEIAPAQYTNLIEDARQSLRKEVLRYSEQLVPGKEVKNRKISIWKAEWTDEDRKNLSRMVESLENIELYEIFETIPNSSVFFGKEIETGRSRKRRIEAARQLGQIGGISAGKVLAKCYSQSVEDVKAAVGESLNLVLKAVLQQTPDSTLLPPEVYDRPDKAAELFDNGDVQFALAAAGEKALPFIAARLSKADIEGKTECIAALGKIGTDDAAYTLLQYTSAAERRLCTAAINALADCGSPLAAEPLQKILRLEHDKKSRRRLLRAILATNMQGSETPTFMEIMTDALVDSDPEARKAIIEFLRKNEETAQKLRMHLGEGTIVREKLRSWLIDQDADTHYTAIRGLAILGKAADIVALEGARRNTGESAAEMKKAISMIRARE